VDIKTKKKYGQWDKYLMYVEKMLNNDMPIIFEFRHLAGLLGVTAEYLTSVVNATGAHYREFRIPKKNGGKRTISAPYPTLLHCQQWINKNILSKIQIDNSAHGFNSNHSILTNAKEHLNKKNILKLDITDFFHSISIRRVIKIFRELGYPRNISVYLSKLCTFKERLPQGAATSPMLSNIVARGLDKKLDHYSKACQINYTRYADDLTFSGENIGCAFLKKVSLIISKHGFSINEKKTRLYKHNGKRIVTGISVAGDKPKVPRSYKRKLRQEVFIIKKHGYYSHVNKMKIKKPFYIDSIYGKLLFWKFVEPDNNYVNIQIQYIKKLMASL